MVKVVEAEGKCRFVLKDGEGVYRCGVGNSGLCGLRREFVRRCPSDGKLDERCLYAKEFDISNSVG